MNAAASAELETLARAGYRTLAVASGPPGQMIILGLVALYDPLSADSPALLGELRALEVPTIWSPGTRRRPP